MALASFLILASLAWSYDYIRRSNAYLSVSEKKLSHVEVQSQENHETTSNLAHEVKQLQEAQQEARDSIIRLDRVLPSPKPRDGAQPHPSTDQTPAITPPVVTPPVVTPPVVSSKGIGSGTGIGPGNGSDSGGDAGDGVKQIGGGIKGPVIIYEPEPEFSPEATAAKFMGVVSVSLIVDKDGKPQNVHVKHGVGMGLDQKAVEAVNKYRFRPATENGKPVAVYLNIEVNFEIF